MSYNRISLGSSRRRSNVSKKKIVSFVLISLLIFLAIWQKPVKQMQIQKKLQVPVPIEIK